MNSQDCNPSATDLNQVEFHRHGLALVPDPADQKPGVTFFLKGNGNEPDLRICSCSTARRKTCSHILKLVKLYRALQKEFGGRSPQDAFRSSIWYRLATILADKCHEKPGSVHLQFVSLESKKAIRVVGSNREDLLFYLSQGSDAIRFLERLGQVPEKDTVPHRGALLEDLVLFTLSNDEKIMWENGVKTIRRVLEENFWYRLAYHGFREFGDKGINFLPFIEEASGEQKGSVREFRNFLLILCELKNLDSVRNEMLPSSGFSSWIKNSFYLFSFSEILAQVSRSVTVRLNTGALSEESTGSTQK